MPAAGELVCCDLGCYGAASPTAFQEYLAMLGRQHGCAVRSYAHRGAGMPVRGDERAEYADGASEQGTTRTRLWSRLWYRHLLRESCLVCGFHSLDRPGNLTLGDFWGSERAAPGLEDDWGTSCVLVNDARGLELLRAAADRLELREVAVADVANPEQPMLSHPPAGGGDRFWELRRERGFEGACRGLGLLGPRQALRDARQHAASRARAVACRPAGSPCAADPWPSPPGRLEAHAGFPAAFAARNRDACVRRASSSGGVFHALAAHVLERGGVVYGCAFDERLRAVHVRCARMADVERCMGSKYTQSDMGNVLPSVRADIAAGRLVLFTGTPCQVAAARAVCGRAMAPGHAPTGAAGCVPPRLYRRREECSGCSACAAVCPRGAIEMREDEKGFAYPHVDAGACTGCGLCVRACPFKDRVVGPWAGSG